MRFNNKINIWLFSLTLIVSLTTFSGYATQTNVESTRICLLVKNASQNTSPFNFTKAFAIVIIATLNSNYKFNIQTLLSSHCLKYSVAFRVFNYESLEIKTNYFSSIFKLHVMPSAPEAIETTIARDLHQPGLNALGIDAVPVVPEFHKCFLCGIFRLLGVFQYITRNRPGLILILLHPKTVFFTHVTRINATWKKWLQTLLIYLQDFP